MLATCSEFGLVEQHGYWILSTEEAKEVCGEQDIVDEMISAIAACEWKLRFMKMMKQLSGEEPVAMVVTDRDGLVHEYEVKKFHAADYRAAMADLAKIAGILKPTEVVVKLPTVVFDMTGITQDEPKALPEPIELLPAARLN